MSLQYLCIEFLSLLINSHIMLFVVIFLIIDWRGRSLHQKFRLKLILLYLGQLRKLIYDLNVVFETTSANNFPGFPISLSLSDLIMLLSHMHVPSSVGSILLPAIIEAWKLLGKLLGASSDVLFPLGLPSYVSHFNVWDEIIHQLLSFVFISNFLNLGHLISVLLLFSSMIDWISVRHRSRKLVLWHRKLENLVTYSLAQIGGSTVLGRGAFTGGTFHSVRLKDYIVSWDLHIILAPWTRSSLLLPGGEYLFRMVISFVLRYVIHHIRFIVWEIAFTVTVLFDSLPL